MTAKYIEVSAQVRYWEYATINGVEDTNATMLFRCGDLWKPVIRLSDGHVMDWPEGMTADIHYKVCDAGEYWLQDETGKRIAKWAGYYVPNGFLCHCDEGYGDYIIFKIDGNGDIVGYQKPEVEFMCGCEDEDEESSAWRRF